MRVMNMFSDPSFTSLSFPQERVPSSLLFILNTDDFRISHPDYHLVKYVDVCCLAPHSTTAQWQWHDDASLELTREKTKETMLTFSSKRMELTERSVCIFHRQAVEMLEEYNCIGTTFHRTLKFTSNSKDTLRKCQQQQYLLRKLNSFGISKEIPRTFY